MNAEGTLPPRSLDDLLRFIPDRRAAELLTKLDDDLDDCCPHIEAIREPLLQLRALIIILESSAVDVAVWTLSSLCRALNIRASEADLNLRTWDTVPGRVFGNLMSCCEVKYSGTEKDCEALSDLLRLRIVNDLRELEEDDAREAALAKRDEQ